MEKTTRKVVTRSPAHTVRLIHLPHLQEEPIEAESKPERGFVHIAALFPFTRHIQHQPFKLVWEDASYTPDFLLSFKDGSRLVVEVKPETKVEGYTELFDRAAAKLKTQGLQFLVAQDTQITLDDRADNALLVRRYGKTTFSAELCERALALVGQNPGGLCIRNAKVTERIPHEVFLHLVARRLLTMDGSLSIGPAARVFPISSSKEQSHALQFASWFDAEIWE